MRIGSIDQFLTSETLCRLGLLILLYTTVNLDVRGYCLSAEAFGWACFSLS